MRRPGPCLALNAVWKMKSICCSPCLEIIGELTANAKSQYLISTCNESKQLYPDRQTVSPKRLRPCRSSDRRARTYVIILGASPAVLGISKQLMQSLPFFVTSMNLPILPFTLKFASGTGFCGTGVVLLLPRNALSSSCAASRLYFLKSSITL